MLAATDYVGLGTLITAIATSIVAIIVAYRQTNTNNKVDDVHAQVATANGHTLGQLAEKNEARHEAEEVTEKGTP